MLTAIQVGDIFITITKPGYVLLSNDPIGNNWRGFHIDVLKSKQYAIEEMNTIFSALRYTGWKLGDKESGILGVHTREDLVELYIRIKDDKK